METVIEFKNVSKRFTIVHDRPRSLQEQLIRWLSLRRQESTREEFWALDDVSFEIPKGKTVGLIGANGSGKSTALKLMAGILQPTAGEIVVDGRMSALLEVGSGMHPELTGRENIYLNGSLLGISNSEMRKLYPRIVHFSELKRFIDMPVKHYSSGMYMRLGFSIAIHVQPQILLLDEVLAVGDQSFQAKCLDRIYRMKKAKVTIVMVSHALGSLENMCDELIWLKKGICMGQGKTSRMAGKYLRYMHEKTSYESHDIASHEEKKEQKAEQKAKQKQKAEQKAKQEQEQKQKQEQEQEQEQEQAQEQAQEQEQEQEQEQAQEQGEEEEEEEEEFIQRWGSRQVEITAVRFRRGQQYRNSFLTGEPFTVEIHYIAHERISDPMFGLAIHHIDGTHINGPNNKFAGVDFDDIEGAGVVYYTISDLPLMQGTYELSVSAYDAPGIHDYDVHWRAYRFYVNAGGSDEKYGMFHIPGTWEHHAQNAAPLHQQVNGSGANQGILIEK